MKSFNRPAAPAAGLVVSFAALLAAVFYAPYVWPPSDAWLSASVLDGFNNPLSFRLYIVFLVPCILLMRSRWPTGAALPPGNPPLWMRPRAAVVWVVAFHAVLFAALYSLKKGFVFADALYFQEIIYRVDYGMVPYKDTYYSYGPILIYPAVLLMKFMRLEAAYALHYVFNYCVGLYLLHAALSWMIESKKEADAWFILFSFGFINPLAGLNYALVRHLLPIICVIAAYRHVQEPSRSAFLSSAGTLLLALLYSPEIGIVSLVAASAVAVLSLSPRRLLPAIVALAVFLCLFYLMDPGMKALKGYIDPLFSFSAGLTDSPIIPSIPRLTMMLVTILSGGALLACVLKDGVGPSTALAAGYWLITVAMQRATYGVADVPHIAYNALPAFLLSVRLAPFFGAGRQGQRRVALLLLAGVVAPLQFFNVMLFAPSLLKRLRREAPVATAPAQASTPEKKDIQASMVKAVERFGADKTYFMYNLDYYRLPIFVRFKLKPVLYHIDPLITRDPQIPIEELRQSGALIMTLRGELTEEGKVRENDPLEWLYYATDALLPGSRAHNLHVRADRAKLAPVRKFLASSYETILEDGELVVLAPKPSEAGKKRSRLP